MILVFGLCAGFCVLWFLCAQIATAYIGDPSIIRIEPIVQNQSLQTMEFPFEIPGTTLIAEQIVSYDGLFTSGEDTYDVTNVAALLLYNYGDCGIENAQILLQAGAVQLVFVADTIPAGQRLLVMEREGKEYGPDRFSSCAGWQREDMSDWSMADCIKLQYPDMGTVVVTNLTDKKMTGIHLRYKTYYPDADFYVGGQTNCYCIDILEPRESIRINPKFYALEYSRFVQIKIEKP